MKIKLIHFSASVFGLSRLREVYYEDSKQLWMSKLNSNLSWIYDTCFIMGTSHNEDKSGRFLILSFWSQQTQGSLLRRFKVTLDI